MFRKEGKFYGWINDNVNILGWAISLMYTTVKIYVGTNVTDFRPRLFEFKSVPVYWNQIKLKWFKALKFKILNKKVN